MKPRDYSFDPRIKPATIVRVRAGGGGWRVQHRIGQLARVMKYLPGESDGNWPIWADIKFNDGTKARAYNLHSLDYVSEADGTVKAKPDQE